MNYTFQNNSYNFYRYPETSNNSLQAWNAGDELFLNYVEENNLLHKSACLLNDRFGFWACLLPHSLSVFDYKSQEKAVMRNAERNGICATNLKFGYVLGEIAEQFDFAGVKIPKSVEHFELYLDIIKRSLTQGGRVVCSFMTKYFTPQILEVANRHFQLVEQTKAWKKARLLILSNPKMEEVAQVVKTVKNPYGGNLHQYFGVFASGGIDIGTRFLLENFSLKQGEDSILDLASGNGIIAKTLLEINPNAEMHLLDDSYLAVESSKLNVHNAIFHCNDSLDELQANYFNLIITNPPFHFGHETNIEVSLGLFEQAKNCLQENGRLVIVANKHLNYKTHLHKIFTAVQNIHENEKFEIIECVK